MEQAIMNYNTMIERRNAANDTYAATHSSTLPKNEIPKEETALSGLCVNCIKLNECSYYRRNSKPVIFCEEYECAQEIINQAIASPQNDSEVEENMIAGRVKGLCINCERRDTCSFPKPEGGVWHCEEYL